MNPTIAALIRGNPALEKKVKQRRSFRVPPMLYPDQAERAYVAALVEKVNSLEEMAMLEMVPLLERAERESKAQMPTRADSWSTEIAAYIARARIGFEKQLGNAEPIVERIGALVAKLNESELYKVTRAVFGVNILAAEPWLRDTLQSFSEVNVGLIKSLGSDTFSKIQTITQQGVASGRPSASIAKELRETFDVSRSRARLIARDQVGKLNGNLTKTRQEGLGITSYIWRTAGDDRVRKTHRANNGKTFKWSDPPAITGHPGQDFQCRCTSEAVIDTDIFDRGR